MTNAAIKIRPSRSGKILLFLAVFLLLAAQNTGNNLLYLMSSCFITCIIWTGTISFRNMSGLSAKILVPDICFAGQKVVVSCKIEDLASNFHHLIGFEDDYTRLLRPGETKYLRAEFVPNLRGTYYLKEFKVFSSYPADLFLIYLDIEPVLVKVAPKPAESSPGSLSLDPVGSVERQQSGKDGDYWMQLPYQDGEDASLINWAISARSMHEWVLIRSVRTGISRRFYFDLSGFDGEAFEKGLMLVAGLICQLRQEGVEAFVWGEAQDNIYSWLSVTQDLPVIVGWLAGLRPGNIPVPVDTDSEPIRFSDLLRDSL